MDRNVDANFLKETIKILNENGKSFDDVKWIGNSKVKIPISLFLKESDFEYDSGYGDQVIDDSLKIVGSNWWLERNEYDGSEWWTFRTFPKEPKKSGTIQKKSDTISIGTLNLEIQSFEIV